MMKKSRRNFFKNSLALGTAITIPGTLLGDSESHIRHNNSVNRLEQDYIVKKELNLSPARWIWFPSERTLPNTIIFLRKEFDLPDKPIKAIGWVLGESRYKLYSNKKRIQFGPAPSDPRWAEADPVDLTNTLNVGKNIIGAEVLFYGTGDGTWPIGKPGFIFYLEIELSDNTKLTIVSDQTWKTSIARSWRPGQYKRWYLRALQEEFDARIYPTNWCSHADTGINWKYAMEFNGAANKPTLATYYRDYLYDSQAQAEQTELRARSISLANEYEVAVKQLAESHKLKWNSSIEEYFEFVTPDAFEIAERNTQIAFKNNLYEVPATDANHSSILTFELSEQIVGFPYFTIEAPEGTIIELLVHEGHDAGKHVLLNTHFNSWSRFICKAGVNHFETFDYECLRWLQLHIHGNTESVRISKVGVRRRIFAWRKQPFIHCSDQKIQKVINASVNTLYNCAIETIVDGMGRERQQYSGDVGHVLHSVFLTMGEPTLAARFINTYSQGITSQGYFLDCWPAYDRLARIMEREMGMTLWGPLLDHGVGFNFDCYHYFLYTGEVESIKEAFPRLIRFFHYLQSLIKNDGLLPVENIGVPTVWIDHYAYKKQRHKQCAFNLYASAMMQHALAPLCQAFGEDGMALKVKQQGHDLEKQTQKIFWSGEHGMFVCNLPWMKEENEMRICDRSLATAILFNQCPQQQTENSVKALRDVPAYMGISYPANTNWRYWALSKAGDDTLIKEIREKWSAMPSVNLNNTLSEDWNPQPDSNAIWSHCPLSPLFGMHMCVAGIRPLKPGFSEIEIKPILGDIEKLDITTYTTLGELKLSFIQKKGKLNANAELPEGMTGTFVWNNEKRAIKSGKQVLNFK
jgi:alpha-L-rhamnosidase